MRSRFAALAVVALVVATARASAQDDAGSRAAWTEIAWPFLRDAWPGGRAFRCVGGACGDGLMLAARVKVGFCDCTRGVSDDDEIDRVGDVDLVSRDFSPLAPGAERDLAGMKGRTRLYATSDASRARVLTLAGGRDCNAFVATAIKTGDLSRAAADAIAAFIDTPGVSRWIAIRQGGG